jgi:DNA invertase Pin-like site-specific DNA recombinase
MAQVLAVFAEFERRLIGERTKAALAVRRSQGVRLGRPSNISKETVKQILELRLSGTTLKEIADRLNDDAVPTAQGGKSWYPATIRDVVKRAS